MNLNNLRDLYIEQLQDLYSAEEQLTSALPKMVEAAAHPELKTAFRKHLDETKQHRDRLQQVMADLSGTPSGTEGSMMESIYKALGRSPSGEKCEAMAGLIREGEQIVKANADQDVRDAGLIAAAQRVEHYEIAGYGTVCTYAKLLGRTNDKAILGRTLDEEKTTDEKLTDLATRVVNLDAAA
jgi:ferritin-like metal-binding protein YciE